MSDLCDDVVTKPFCCTNQHFSWIFASSACSRITKTSFAVGSGVPAGSKYKDLCSVLTTSDQLIMVVRILCLRTAWPPSHPLKNNHTGGQAVQLSKYYTFTWRALPTCIQPFHISQSFNFSSSFIAFCLQKNDCGHFDGEDKNFLLALWYFWSI